jgi:hypothetical protein
MREPLPQATPEQGHTPDAGAGAIRRQPASGLISQPVSQPTVSQPSFPWADRHEYPPAPGWPSLDSVCAVLARWEVAGVVLRLHARHQLPSIVVTQE